LVFSAFLEHDGIVQQMALDLPVDCPVFSRDEFNQATLRDTEVQRDLIEAFLNEGASCRAELVGMARTNPERFKHAVHRLKGSCHYMAGLRLLSVLGLMTERVDMDSAQGRVRAAECIIQELVHLEGALAVVLAELKDT
jgi:hypothetical protein